MDWFDNPYVSSGQTAGIIIANNSKEYLVLADAAPLAGVETIHVTFCDNSQVEAQMKMSDSTTGLAVLAVDSKEIGQPILDKIETAVLGSSNDTALTGSPVIALGSPMGISGSLMYGIATSCEVVSNTVDSEYKLITTDICGSRNGTGVLINLKGEVIGLSPTSFMIPVWKIWSMRWVLLSCGRRLNASPMEKGRHTWVFTGPMLQKRQTKVCKCPMVPM